MPENLPPNASSGNLVPASDKAAESQDPQDDQLKAALKDLISENVLLDIDREKVYQYAQARKNELYFRGNQYVYPVLANGMTADWTTTNGSMGYSAKEDDREAQYDYVLNLIRGDGQKFIAVLGQRGPNVKAQARRPDDEAAVRRSRKADIAATYLRSNWTPERIQRHLAMALWKNGTTFAYTPWTVNGEKYGVVEEPIIEAKPTIISEGVFRCIICGAETVQSSAGNPPTCSNPTCHQPLQPQDFIDPISAPMPTVVGSKKYPKGTVELHLATIFEVTVPFYARDLHDCPWLWYEYEEHKGKLIKAFPDLRNRLGEEDWSGGDSSGVSAQGRLARDVASSPTGSYVSPRKNRWLYSRFWLRPAMYELLLNDQLRKMVEEKFPKGVKVTMVQGEVVAMDSEQLDDVWAMCKPGVSEYIFADPVCKDYMGIQDIINDLYNLTVETMERSIPFLLADPMVLDVLQFNKQRGKPGQIIPAKAGVGQRLEQGLARAPVASVDPEIFKFLESIHQTGREMVGVMPAIFGGGEPDPTARAAELRRNQALQQLNTVWNEMREFWAAVYYNGCRQLAAHSLPDASNLGNYEEGDADFSDLNGGGFYFTTEEAIPMTWGQKRDLVMFLLQSGPEAQKLFGLDHPLNVAKVADTLGFVDWKVPQVAAREKVLNTIKLLLQGQSIPAPPGPPDPMTGQPGPPGPPQPSIPPDAFEDDHIFVASVIKEWAQDEDARAQKELNPAGYANVMAYGQASIALTVPPPGMAPAPGPGGATPPKPPGGPPQGTPNGPHVTIPPNGASAPSGAAVPPPPGSEVGGPFIPGPTSPSVGPPPPR